MWLGALTCVPVRTDIFVSEALTSEPFFMLARGNKNWPSPSLESHEDKSLATLWLISNILPLAYASLRSGTPSAAKGRLVVNKTLVHRITMSKILFMFDVWLKRKIETRVFFNYSLL